MTTLQLTQADVIAASDAIDAYNKETFAGGEPTYPQWAADIVAQARREGLIGVKEGEVANG